MVKVGYLLDAIASLKQTKNGLVEFTFSKGKKMSYFSDLCNR